MVELLTHLTTVTLTSDPSQTHWIVNGTSKPSFSSSTVYCSFFDHTPTVPWQSIIWLKRGIPKHTSLAWLMLLNRTPTRDRLLSWGLQTDPLCLLCNRSNESRNHLYFECSFSGAIWNKFATTLGASVAARSWDDVTQSLLSFSGSNQLRCLLILSWQATIYEVWWERNSRLHRGTFRSVDSISKKIKGLIKNKISSLRSPTTSTASSLMQIWFSLFDGDR